jgi:hypothetical protein
LRVSDVSADISLGSLVRSKKEETQESTAGSEKGSNFVKFKRIPAAFD